MSQILIIGSTEAYSGKSAVILGLANYLSQQGIRVTYGKPIGACAPGNCPPDGTDPDILFMASVLNLHMDQMPPMLLRLDEMTIREQIRQPQLEHRLDALKSYQEKAAVDLILLEGPGDLQEGYLFDLSLEKMAERLDAKVVLISRYHSALVLDGLLCAQQRLGSRLAGVVINDISPNQHELVKEELVPFLEARGIPVLGLLPANRILRSISVGELANQLDADPLCCADRMDFILIEEFIIGAMSVNSALKYFRKSEHKAVITGGDRTDIQLAALETATACLILTGKHPLDPRIRVRAEELEVPILSVDLDTFTTSERIERVFGQVRLHETVKVNCIQELMSENFDFSRLYGQIGLTQPLVAVATRAAGVDP